MLPLSPYVTFGTAPDVATATPFAWKQTVP